MVKVSINQVPTLRIVTYLSYIQPGPQKTECFGTPVNIVPKTLYNVKVVEISYVILFLMGCKNVDEILCHYL